MKVLKICINTWENASRDKRELAVCRELGADVEVIAKGLVSGQRELVDGFPVIRLSTKPFGSRMPNAINRVVSVFSWANYIHKMKDVDVISGHDYIALLIGYLSNCGKKKKAKLVYDSHEFELGRNTKRSKLVTFFVAKIEKFLMRRCAFSIMVNDAIADEVVRIHKLDQHPFVVRNIPNYWNIDQDRIAQKRKEILEENNLPDTTFLVMYHGSVSNDRGIEQMVAALAQTEGTAGIILGNGGADYIECLHNLCVKYGIEDRVIFHEAVPMQELWNYVGIADVGMVTVLPTFKSYYFMLPNKFFENIQAMIPVIVSDFPAIGEIVDRYSIGLKVDPTNTDAIAEAICRLRDDRELYATLKTNLKSAKEELCWEKEKEVLLNAYAKILK